MARLRSSLVGLLLLALAATGASASTAPATGAPPQNSQSDRADALREMLPIGESPDFYWGLVQAMGYEVEAIDYEKHRRVGFDLTKDGTAYTLLLELADRSTRVEAIEVSAVALDALGEEADWHNGPGIVPAGTRIPVRLERRLSSDNNAAGDRFTMTVSETVDEDLPRGAVIEGAVVSAEPAERPRRSGKLVLEAIALRRAADTVELDAAITTDGESADEGVLDKIGDLKEVGIGAAVGAVVGGLIKGTKGALVGLIIGGAGTFLATEGEDVELPAGTPLVLEIIRDFDTRSPPTSASAGDEGA